MNMLSLLLSERAIKARKQISTCHTLMTTESSAFHELTAYKGASFEKKFTIEFLQYWKVAVVQFFCCAGLWYITDYYYRIHKIKAR